MKAIQSEKNTRVQFRFREILESKPGRVIPGSTTKTITYMDFDEAKFWFAIKYLVNRFTHSGMKKKGIHINVFGERPVLFYISDKYKFDVFKQELLKWDFKTKMTVREELEDLIKRRIPEQVGIVGEITYPQTLETPEERAELEFDLDPNKVLEKLSESIDIIADTINELHDSEGDIVDEMQRSFDRGDYND